MPSDKIILHVGSQYYDFTDKGTLLKSWDNVSSGEYWSTVADCNEFNDFYKVLNCADDIIYYQDAKWDGDLKIWTEYFLHVINQEKNNVTGLPDIINEYKRYLKLKEGRVSDKPCIFIAGCSITQGLGVEKDEIYASLIGKELKKDVVNLGQNGSSISMQSDQIIRSDVRKGDTVIWGLTNEHRVDFYYWTENRPGKNKRHEISETRDYLVTTSIHRVKSFCNKIGVRLIIVPLFCSEMFQMSLIGDPDYLQLPFQPGFIDIGSDGEHPGPQQHRAWADFILEKCFA